MWKYVPLVSMHVCAVLWLWEPSGSHCSCGMGFVETSCDSDALRPIGRIVDVGELSLGA